MVVMNAFETADHDPRKLRGCRLISSLEPCPMCMTRLIFAGVGTIRYVKGDHLGGMVQRRTSLPPIFQEITASQGQEWGEADCPEALREAAFEIWHETRADVDDQVVHRVGGKGDQVVHRVGGKGAGRGV
jgi:cytosine deaminase